MIKEHLTDHAGLPVVDFLDAQADEHYLHLAGTRPASGSATGPRSTQHARMEEARKDPGSVAWRLRLAGYAEEFVPYLDRFFAEVDTSPVTALVIGDWGFEDGCDASSLPLRDALIRHAGDLPALRSLFIGDVTFEENEISWIQQCDLAPLLDAYPLLEELTVRGTGDTYDGGETLSLAVGGHRSLRSLTVQSGGLPGRVAREVVAADLPALERLELWLGMANYDGDTVVEDLSPLLHGEALPALRHLGVRNAQHTGDWLRALAGAPLTARLRSADLSLGTLRDDDVEHLLASVPAFAHLESLDLHHHYLDEGDTERVRAAFTEAGVRVDLSDGRGSPTDGNVHYFPAVGE